MLGNALFRVLDGVIFLTYIWMNIPDNVELIQSRSLSKTHSYVVFQPEYPRSCMRGLDEELKVRSSYQVPFQRLGPLLASTWSNSPSYHLAACRCRGRQKLGV